MPRLRKARKELLTTMMKESIFEATTSVLCEHGVDGTTMNRVAETAELAKSSLYDYFPSKDELLEFVSDRLQVPFLQVVEETLRPTCPRRRSWKRSCGWPWRPASSTRPSSSWWYSPIRLPAEAEDPSANPGGFHGHFCARDQGRLFPPAQSGAQRPMFLGAFHELFELLACSASEEAANEYVERADRRRSAWVLDSR